MRTTDWVGSTRPLTGPTPCKTCPKCEQTKPMSGFYADRHSTDGHSSWCKTCVNGRPKPQTEARIIRSRARHRAMARLVETYPDAFQALYEEERATALAEAEELRDHPLAKQGTIRLQKGRRNPGEQPLDRVDLAWCPACSNYHAAGHPDCVSPKHHDIPAELVATMTCPTCEELILGGFTGPACEDCLDYASREVGRATARVYDGRPREAAVS